MTQRLLRHIPSGVIYAYQDAFAIRSDFEEVVTVVEAPEVKEPAPVKKPAKRPKYEVSAIDEELLSADASRGL